MTNPPTSPPRQQGSPDRPRQSIPLQNLSPPPGASSTSQAAFGLSQPDGQDARTRYERRSPTTAQMAANLPGISAYWENPYHPQPGEASRPESPVDTAAFQFALPPDIRQSHPMREARGSSHDPYETSAPYDDEPQHNDFGESDRVPLTATAQPIAGLGVPSPEPSPRTSFQTVHDLDASPRRSRDTRMLGFDLESGFTSKRHHSYGASLAPEERDRRRSRSPSTSAALHRTASIVRAMSQRVVNISGDVESVEQARLSRSRSPSVDGRQRQHLSEPMLVDTSYPSQTLQTPIEKQGGAEYPFPVDPAPLPPRPSRMPNPLKGKSLGIFSPNNPIRTKLCDLLVLPWTEPLILLLIVLQTVLLAVEAGPNVFTPGNERPGRWGRTRIDWALFFLFIVFTLELIARIIVSGFVLNAAEYSTIDRKKGIRAAVTDQYRSIFRPQRQRSVKKPPQEAPYGPSTFARSFTFMARLPQTVEEQQRMQLARRAFLRHGFNRLDFVAVVSFWISFVLGISGQEKERHIYVFRMLSCLRILRLLAITKGNAIILRSLKKAAPLLVRVSFFIAFFWLLFAIIGVQSFKSSLSRQCVWINPEDPTNIDAAYNNDMEFCGGYLNETTGAKEPWVLSHPPGTLHNLRPGTGGAKGFICPQGSLCLEQGNPYNGTVNFDNILNSLETVFVIMSANTWSDLMYYTTNSDYLTSALFFGAGIMIMMLWLTNLLIAVITSSFQVIREEGKASAFAANEDTFTPARSDEKAVRISALQHLYNRTSGFWTLCILVDLICQALRSSKMGADRAHFIKVSNIVATVLLDIEITIRIVADFRRFHRNLRNLADLGLAVMTTILLLPPIANSGRPYAWLSIFEILRVYRVVLAVPVTGKLIKLVLGNALGIGNLMLFVFLMTFLVSIFAAQLFRGEIPMVDGNGNTLDVSFFSIWNSFLGMYQILSSENWTDILYSVTATTTQFHTAWIGAIFLIGWFTLAFFILVNMFIAVIQENFDVGEDIKRLEQVRAFLQRKELGSNSSNLALSTIFSLGRANRRKDPLDYGPAMMEMLLKEAVVHEFLDESMDPLQQTPTAPLHSPPQPTTGAGAVKPGPLSTIWGKLVTSFTARDPNPFYSNVRFDNLNDTLDPREMARQAVSATSERRKAQRAYLARHPTYNNSLFIFTPKNPLRRLCQRLVGPGRGTERFDGVKPHKAAWYTFSALIYLCIVAMVILACVTTPLYQKEYFETHHFSVRNWFVWTDMAFAAVFTAEAVIKVVADGFFWTPNAYFRSSWGVIDAIVLITLWINVGTLLSNDGAVSRAVGAFKALRALRLLNVSDSARETFHSLIIIGWWKIMSAAFVSISLLIPFAIYGVNLFNGQMVACNDGDSVTVLRDCFGEWNSTPYNGDWPLLAPRVAANPQWNFDDFGSSLFILFQIVSQEGWIDVSFSAQAITGKGLQPQSFASQGNAVFFVVFNLLSTVFVLTLFISVFMRNYTEQTGVAFLTTEQRSWLELRKLLRQISPSKSSYDASRKKWKRWCHKRAIEKRGKWYVGITCVLVLHLILLLLEYLQEPDWWTRTRDFLFLVFTLIYITNVMVRIIGLGWSRFRRSSWDLFSLVAVSGAFATSILFLTDTKRDTYNQLHKFFLVAIVLLLIPRNDALDQLFKTAAASLPNIANLLATWLVFFLVFAIGMTQTFSLTRFGGNEDNHVNFRDVPNSLILLFRMTAGEGWNSVMEDFAGIKPPLCVEGSSFFDSDCGSTPWARVLFTAWNILSMYIFVNLFISLIYENFSYVYQRSSGLAVVDRDEIRRFKEAWRSVDPAGTGFISKETFPRLLGELSGVFEMRIYDAEDSVPRILEDIRSDAMASRHSSVANQSALTSVNLKKLNERLALIDVKKVRERRRRFNVFFEEVMVSADPDRGISFTAVLMILAHYNVISDSKSLRLEEFLRRRARLQRVEEEVRRRIVLGFFDTLYWSRWLRRQKEMKRSARMTVPPQLDVPDILIDDEEERAQRQSQPPLGRQRAGSSFLSPDETRAHHRTWSNTSEDISLHDTSYAHPLSFPRFGHPFAGAPTGAGGGELQQHRPTASASSFELQEPASGQSSASNSRRGSAVSPAQVREMLDDSVWVESIRRSATMRRPDW